MSTILGIISVVSLGIVIYLSYRKDGQAPAGYGMTGFLAMVYSLVGLGLGVVSARDRDYFRLFPWLGIVLNALALGCISFLLYFGSGGF